MPCRGLVLAREAYLHLRHSACKRIKWAPFFSTCDAGPTSYHDAGASWPRSRGTALRDRRPTRELVGVADAPTLVSRQDLAELGLVEIDHLDLEVLSCRPRTDRCLCLSERCSSFPTAWGASARAGPSRRVNSLSAPRDFTKDPAAVLIRTPCRAAIGFELPAHASLQERDSRVGGRLGASRWLSSRVPRSCSRLTVVKPVEPNRVVQERRLGSSRRLAKGVSIACTTEAKVTPASRRESPASGGLACPLPRRRRTTWSDRIDCD